MIKSDSCFFFENKGQKLQANYKGTKKWNMPIKYAVLFLNFGQNIYNMVEQSNSNRLYTNNF